MTTLQKNHHDLLLDARGMNCPLPILKTRKALKGLPTGQTLKVMTTDPGAIQDIASFCKTTGDELTAQSNDEDVFNFFIRKN